MKHQVAKYISISLLTLILGAAVSLVTAQYYYFSPSTTTTPYQQGCNEQLDIMATTANDITGAAAGLLSLRFDPLHFSYFTGDNVADLQVYLFEANVSTIFPMYSNPLLFPQWIDTSKTILHIDRYKNGSTFLGTGLYGKLYFTPRYSPLEYTGTFTIVYANDTIQTSLSYGGKNIIDSGYQYNHLTGYYYVYQKPCVDDLIAPTPTISPNGGTKKSHLSGIQLTLLENIGNTNVPYVWTGGLPGIGIRTGNNRGINNQYGVNFDTFVISISGNNQYRYFTGGMFSPAGTLSAIPSFKTWQYRNKNFVVNIDPSELFDYGIEKKIEISGYVSDRNNNISDISTSFNTPIRPWLITGSTIPAGGAVGVTTTTPVRLGIADDRAGVNSGTIIITLSGINGTNYGPYIFSGDDLNLSGVQGIANQPDYYITISGHVTFPSSGIISVSVYAEDMAGNIDNINDYFFTTKPSCADYGCCHDVYIQTGTNLPFFYTGFILNISGGLNPSFTGAENTGFIDCGLGGSSGLSIYKGTEYNTGIATYVSYHDLPNLVISGYNVKATLSGTTLYLQKIYIPPVLGGGAGGGGGGQLYIDNCLIPSQLACANEEGEDYSESFYDNTCCALTTGHTAPSCDVSDSPYNEEITDAFLRGYNLNITNKCPIDTARLDDNIKRIEAAKMLSMFTIQVIGLYPDTHKLGCDAYNDISSLTPEMRFYAQTACQLNIMGLEQDGKTPKKSFDPYDLVDRPQFGTMLSRLVYGDKYNIYPGEESLYQRYEKHLKALNRDGIMTKIQNPWILEKRARVLIMLHRIYTENLVAQYRLVAPAHNGAIVLLENVW